MQALELTSESLETSLWLRSLLAKIAQTMELARESLETILWLLAKHAPTEENLSSGS